MGSFGSVLVETAVNTAAATTITVALPAGAQQGDAMLLMVANGDPDSYDDNVDDENGSDTNWTVLDDFVVSSGIFIGEKVWYKTVSADDAANAGSRTFTVTAGSTVSSAAALLVFPGATLPPDDTTTRAVSGAVSTDSPQPPAMTPDAGNLAVALYMYGSDQSDSETTLSFDSVTEAPNWQVPVNIAGAVGGEFDGAVLVATRWADGSAIDQPQAHATVEGSWVALSLSLAQAAGAPAVPIEQLTDDFNDNSVDSTKWPDSFGTVSESGGQAVVDGASSLSGYGSVPQYALKDSAVYAKVTPPTPSLGQEVVGSYLTCYLNPPTYKTFLRFLVSSADTASVDPEIACSYTTNSNANQVFRHTAVYDTVNHAWLRIRESSGTLFFEASPSGEASTWATLFTETTPAEVLQAGGIELDLESEGGTSPNQVGTFDNVNVAPPSKPSVFLNLGTDPGENHFGLQVGVSGESEVRMLSVQDMDAGFELADYFEVNSAGDAVVMHENTDAPQISGSSGPRTELREYDDAGNEMGFNPFVGTHWMRVKFRVTHLGPGTSNGKDLVVAQLHNGDVDRVAIRTDFQNTNTRLRTRINGSTSGTTDMINESGDTDGSASVIGTMVDAMIKVIDGNLYVYKDDMVTPLMTRLVTDTSGGAAGAAGGPLAPTAGVDTWYFKSGAYLQWDDSIDPGGFGEMEILDLQHYHTGWALPGTTNGALVGELTDNFDDNAIGTEWPLFFGSTIEGETEADVGITEQGQKLHIEPLHLLPTTTGPASDTRYRFIDTEVFVQASIVTAPAGATTTALALSVYINDTYQEVVQLIADASAGTLTAFRTDSGGNTVTDHQSLGTYDPEDMAWLRVRESVGTLYYEYSADGLTWTTGFSETTPSDWVAGTTGSVALLAGSDAAGAVFEFDNLNVEPTVTEPAKPASQFMPFFT